MSTTTVPHVLVRVYADAAEERVSTHPTFEEGWSAGTSAVHRDFRHAYALYRGHRRVARFCYHRLTAHQGDAILDRLVSIGGLS